MPEYYHLEGKILGAMQVQHITTLYRKRLNNITDNIKKTTFFMQIFEENIYQYT